MEIYFKLSYHEMPITHKPEAHCITIKYYIKKIKLV